MAHRACALLRLGKEVRTCPTRHLRGRDTGTGRRHGESTEPPSAHCEVRHLDRVGHGVSSHTGNRSALEATERAECPLRRPRARPFLARGEARAGGAIASQPTLRQAWHRERTDAAICVQDVNVQCVLQFTLIHTVGCALHRHTSRVIHRLELSLRPGRAKWFGPQRPRNAEGRADQCCR